VSYSIQPISNCLGPDGIGVHVAATTRILSIPTLEVCHGLRIHHEPKPRSQYRERHPERISGSLCRFHGLSGTDFNPVEKGYAWA
jgi:hypothetical protein